MEDIYQNDLIGRKEFVDKLLTIIGGVSSDRPWSFAINGRWGTGKTFVFSLLKKELDNMNGVVCIEYNAWKNDFYDDPLISILFSMLDYFESIDDLEKETIQKLKNIIDMAKYSLSYLPGFSRMEKVTEFFKENHRLWKRTRKKETDKGEFNQYSSYSDLINKTQEFIRTAVGNNKLVILVDEIDRCTPEYAMKVLERMHYIFNIPNIIVIVNVNKEQLEKVLSNKYSSMEKEIYLTKFFDRTIELPNEKRKHYKKEMCKRFIRELGVIVDGKADCFIEILSNELGFLTEREVFQRFEIFKFAISNMDKEERFIQVVFVMCFYINKILNEKLFYEKLIGRTFLRKNEIIDYYYKNGEITDLTLKYLEDRRLSTETKRVERNNHIYITRFTEKELEKIFYLINFVAHMYQKDIETSLFELYGIQGFEVEDAKTLTSILRKYYYLFSLV